VNGYKNENNYFVWDSITDSIGAVYGLLSNTDYHELLDAFGIKLYTTLYDTISWDEKASESSSDSLLRSLVISIMGSFGFDKVVNESKLRFKAHNHGGDQIPANLRGAIYTTVARNATEEEFQQFFDMYKSADSSAERSRIGYAMGSTEKPELITKVLNFSLGPDVRSQDAPGIITSVTGTLVGRELAWQFFQKNKDEIGIRYSNDYLIGRVIKGIIAGFASEAKASEIEQFFKMNQFAGSQRAIQQSLESIRLKAAWLAKDGEAIKTFLSSKP